MNWIYCTDRLPDTNRDVLVTVQHGDDYTFVSIDSYWAVDREWLNNDGINTGLVIAWAELPEPVEVKK